MKKLLTLFFAVIVSGAFTVSAQELIYAENWDTTNSEVGILSTQLGGADPDLLVVAADNFVVPEGTTWTIIELWHRGYVSADSEGNPLAAPDGVSFHIFSDANGMPDTLVVQETLMNVDATGDSIALAPTETLELQAGTYWIAFTGYYESATDLSNAGWNVITWRESTDPLNGSVPYILDEGNLLGLDASGWQPATDLGLAFGALDFAIWGTTGTAQETYTVTFNVIDDQGTAIEGAIINLGPFTNEAGDYVFEEVPAGTHDYTVTATGYGIGEGQITVEGDMTVDVTLTQVDTYTVTFSVLDTANNALENATIVLGPFTNDAGDYVFESVPAGSHEYTVSLENYQDFTDTVEVTDADVEVVVNLVEAAETFAVTFNVDMQGAVAQGDVPFDPEVHDVYIAGSFPGDQEWNQPGTDTTLMLMPATTEKGQEQVFYEGFTTENIPDGWMTIDADGDGNNWYMMGANQYYDPLVGEYGAASASWDDTALTPDNWLITPQIAGVGDDYQLMFQVKAFDDGYYEEKYDVLVSTTDTEPESFTSIHSETLGNADRKQVTLDLSDYAGEDIYIAFRHWDVTDMNNIILDEVIVEGTSGGPTEEPMIYTITLDLPAGDYMYKYFLVADEPTWDLGEWQGDPNREVTVSEAMTIDDVWGQQPGTSVEDLVNEQGLVVYPNPSSSTVNVASAQLINEIRIFDLAGRMVFSNTIEDYNAVIDVNQFKDGVYFMQIFGEKGVETQKIQIMK